MTESVPPDHIIACVRQQAIRSPCAKSKRGAVVFGRKALVDEVEIPLAAHYNTPPAPFACDGSAKCRAACNKICVHAERGALDRALIHPSIMAGLIEAGSLELVHVKVLGGTVVAGGPPSCVSCSKEILAVGIAGVYLYERTSPVTTCSALFGNRPDDGDECGSEAKHRIVKWSEHTHSEYVQHWCSDHFPEQPFSSVDPPRKHTGVIGEHEMFAPHDHLACIAWQIEDANAGAVWRHYTAYEFHLRTLINLGLPTTEKQQ